VTRNPCNKKTCLVGGCSPPKQLILQSIKLLWWIWICLHLVCHKIFFKKICRHYCLRCKMFVGGLPNVSEIQSSFPLKLLPPACCTWQASHSPLTSLLHCHLDQDFAVPHRIPDTFMFPQLVWTCGFLPPSRGMQCEKGKCWHF
jgi:hypothetical protein